MAKWWSIRGIQMMQGNHRGSARGMIATGGAPDEVWLNVWIIYCEYLDKNGKLGAVKWGVSGYPALMIGAGAERNGKPFLVICKVVIYLWWITKPWFDKVEHSNESFSRSFSLSNLSFVLFRVSVCEFLSRWTWWISRSFGLIVTSGGDMVEAWWWLRV